MKARVATLLAALSVGPATASSCIMPTARQDFATSEVVVAAEVQAVSLIAAPGQPGKFRRTILWRVHESWKGGHAYGSDFTTREVINCPRCVAYKLHKGQMMLLYLDGHEPYQLPWCSRTNRLESSLKDVPLLYRLAGR